MGWERDDSPKGQDRHRLMMVGITRDQADALIAQHDLERIERQLDWLSLRSAKNPPAFLVAAIEGDYESRSDCGCSRRRNGRFSFTVRPSPARTGASQTVPPRKCRICPCEAAVSGIATLEGEEWESLRFRSSRDPTW